MYYYSKRSSRRIVHIDTCRYYHKFSEKNIGCFYTLEDANAAGYYMCKCCAPIRKFLRGNEGVLNEFCQKNGIAYYLDNNEIIVEAPYSKWRIRILPNGTKIVLYHQNTINLFAWGEVPGYHKQNVFRHSVIEYLQYIVEHEAYRRHNPILIPLKVEPPRKGTKRWKREQERLKKEKRKEQISRVMQLFETLELEHSY